MRAVAATALPTLDPARIQLAGHVTTHTIAKQAFAARVPHAITACALTRVMTTAIARWAAYAMAAHVFGPVITTPTALWVRVARKAALFANTNSVTLPK